MTAARPAGPLASPGHWLHHAALAWQRDLTRRLRPLGLTPTQFMILGAVGWLADTDRPPTQQAVADLAGVDRMMTSKVISGLEARALVERSDDPTDGRTRRLRQTATGKKAALAAVEVVTAVDRDFFSGEDSPDLTAAFRRLATR
ncbi:MAG: MarR family winged helix-turn-helix transcriptional regulator [Acidimicrobiales bacterium]